MLCEGKPGNIRDAAWNDSVGKGSSRQLRTRPAIARSLRSLASARVKALSIVGCSHARNSICLSRPARMVSPLASLRVLVPPVHEPSSS